MDMVGQGFNGKREVGAIIFDGLRDACDRIMGRGKADG